MHTKTKISQETILRLIAVSGLFWLVKKRYQKEQILTKDEDEAALKLGTRVMRFYSIGIVLWFVSAILRIEFLGIISDAVLSLSILMVFFGWMDILCAPQTNQEEWKDRWWVWLLFFYGILTSLRGYNVRMIIWLVLAYVIYRSHLFDMLTTSLNDIGRSYIQYPEERRTQTKATLWYESKRTLKLSHIIFVLLLGLRTRQMRELNLLHYIFVGCGILFIILKYRIQRANLPIVPYIDDFRIS